MKCVVCGLNEPEETCKSCHAILYSKYGVEFDSCVNEHKKQNETGKRVLDLFAGCGGFSHGFLKAGYDIVAFVEQWQPAIKTFQKNHPHAKLLGTDITKIPYEEIKPYENKIDVIIGGPPCQGFSLCGKRDPKDKRNKLYKQFLRFVNVINPQLVVMENVPSLLSMKDADGELFISKIFRDFNELNYSVCYKILSASDYGVAQNRRRLIIVARKIKYFPYKLQERKKTVMEAIEGLPKEINGHVVFETKEETIEKFKNLKQGEKLSPTFNFSRQRLHADKPSKTVTTKPTFIHPYENRFLTPRELARLQSFPDDFIFCGSKTAMVKQIGNAVPPLLSEAIAKKIAEVC